MKSRRLWGKINMGNWQEVLVMGYDQSTLYSCMMVSKKKLEKKIKSFYSNHRSLQKARAGLKEETN